MLVTVQHIIHARLSSTVLTTQSMLPTHGWHVGSSASALLITAQLLMLSDAGHAVIPLHYSQQGLEHAGDVNQSQLMQLTIAALPQGSQIMW